MFQKGKKYYNSISKITFLVLFIIIVWSVFNLKRWEKTESVGKIITSDVVSYYAYLPATFVFGDIKLDFLDNPDVNNKDKRLFWPERLNNELEKIQ